MILKILKVLENYIDKKDFPSKIMLRYDLEEKDALEEERVTINQLIDAGLEVYKQKKSKI